jgi:hypothetical protein
MDNVTTREVLKALGLDANSIGIVTSGVSPLQDPLFEYPEKKPTAREIYEKAMAEALNQDSVMDKPIAGPGYLARPTDVVATHVGYPPTLSPQTLLTGSITTSTKTNVMKDSDPTTTPPKPLPVDDLRMAVWHIEREIAKRS